MSENLHKVFMPAVNGFRKFKPYNGNSKDFFNLVKSDVLKKKVNWFESIYVYTDTHLANFQKQYDNWVALGKPDDKKLKPSLAGIEDVQTDKVVFDFDSKNVEIAFAEAKVLATRLLDVVPRESIRCFFSGNKGFHIEVQFTNEFIDRSRFENIIYHFAGDLPTFDVKIKDEQRLFRYPLSINPETKMYKTPFTVDEFLQEGITLQDIKDYASNPDFEERIAIMESFITIAIPEAFKTATKKKEEKKETSTESTSTLETTLDLSKRPLHLSPAKYVIHEGFFEEGERNEACMILASTYKFLGYDMEHAYNMIKATLRKRTRRLGLPEYDKAELWNTIIEPVYGPHWKGGTFDEGEGLLKKVKARFNLDDKFNANTTIKISELLDITEGFLKDLDKNRIYTGMQSLDKDLILTKGMLFGVVGCPGSGKTSFLNVFAENTSKNYGPVLYFSMDMSRDLLGTKILQRYTGYSIEKLQDMIKHGTTDKLYKEAREKLVEDYGKVIFNFENGMDVAMISDEIKRQEDKQGCRMSMVAVDYLEKVQGPYSEETANSGFVASNLANLAKRHDTCIGLLLQPSKATGAPSDPIKSYRAIKGASKIEQDCRAVIGIWRPGYSPEDFANDKYMSIAILKQNMGKLGRYDYSWDGSRGHVAEMTKDERTRFANFLADLEQQKAEEEGGQGAGFKRFGNKANGGDVY